MSLIILPIVPFATAQQPSNDILEITHGIASGDVTLTLERRTARNFEE